ncbi:chromate transporter [Spirochaeta africana]|uniref:Chromate transport protein ChrA n=1 Tax=Spirochaeta africana (strain ATCC 700263 / DSM 8902 / Z-7692) TaxID=889378 RepID=H9UM63_SPIAZ|nr:chromate transporter [Spirochaeta africana]AFG38606.1 chromate transport protein ChrA [Spirochaeta africana DSM 8902]
MLFELFQTFFVIGAGAFGGGIAAVSLIIHEVVQARGWLTPAEMNEVIAISQMTPGPIAINSGTFVGYRVAGVPGAAAATLGVITPPLLALTAFVLLVKLHAHFTDGGNDQVGDRIKHSLKPGIFAMILFAVWSIGSSAISGFVTGGIALAGFALLISFRRLHPVLVVLAAGLAGVILL